MAKIAHLFRYPVKGLTPEALESITLEPGDGVPLDRKFALARPGAPFDPARPRWLSKTNFLMLMRDEQLAGLRAAYDDERQRLVIDHGGTRVVDADLATPAGRAAVEAFFEQFMGCALDGRPRLLEAPGHAFTDNSRRYVSLINLASVRELERAAGRPVDPLRFRANLYVDELPAWAEFEWLGEELAVEDGTVRFRAAERIQRCAATEVDPDTAERDLNVPVLLRRHFGHIDCGVYLKVTEGGPIEAGRRLVLQERSGAGAGRAAADP